MSFLCDFHYKAILYLILSETQAGLSATARFNIIC